MEEVKDNKWDVPGLREVGRMDETFLVLPDRHTCHNSHARRMERLVVFFINKDS